MITFFLSLMFFLFSHSFFFFSSFILLNPPVLFMLSIFPLVACYTMGINFNFSNLMDLHIYKTIFFFFFFFLSLCFSCFYSFLFLLFLEMCVLFMIMLIFNFSKDSDKSSSLTFMFLTNVVGSIPFLYFCSLSESLSFTPFSSSSFSSLLVLFCSCLLLLSKLPLFFFHFWLTKAHVSASGSGSVILASIMLKIGTIGMLKISLFFFCLFSLLTGSFLIFCLYSSVFLLIVMNRFFDFKYLVACSSIVHMSLIFPFLLSGSCAQFYSSILVMVGHGIVSCLVFFLVTLIYEVSHSRSLGVNKSFESIFPTLSFFLLFWFLMNLGFPPFLSFMGEIFFFFCCFFHSFTCLYMFFLVVLISGLFFVSVVLSFLFSKSNIFFGGPISLDLSVLSVGSILFFLLSQSFL